MKEEEYIEKECIKFYSKESCPPCRFWFAVFEKKYKKCYDKVVIETNKQAEIITEKFGVKTIPFMLLPNGEVLSSRELHSYIRNI